MTTAADQLSLEEFAALNERRARSYDLLARLYACLLYTSRCV